MNNPAKNSGCSFCAVVPQAIPDLSQLAQPLVGLIAWLH